MQFNCLFHWNHCLLFTRRHIIKRKWSSIIKTQWKDYLLCFKVGITHFIRHINSFSQPVWSRYNTISHYKLLIRPYLPNTVCNTRALSVFTNSRKLKRLDCVSSFQTFPRTSKNHLPPLYRNIVLCKYGGSSFGNLDCNVATQ